MGLETALIISAVAAVAGTGYSIYQGQKAAGAQKKAAQTAAKQEALQNQRQRRQAIREARIKQAAAVNQAVQTGAGTTSGIAGGIGGLQSQLGSNLGYSSQQGGLSNLISKYNQQVIDAQGQAALGQGIATLGGTAFKFFAGGGGFGSGGSPAPTAAPYPGQSFGVIRSTPSFTP